MTIKTMNRYPAVALATLVVITSCSSDPDPRLVRIRDQANPILEQLREPARAILMMMGGNLHDARMVISACIGSDAPLEQVRSGDFEYYEGGPGPLGISWAAARLLDDRHLFCSKETDYAIRDCARWCVVSWTRLVTEVERLRVTAARRGVDIASIAP